MDRFDEGVLRDLEGAIAGDDLELHYQPQVTANLQRVAAVEALARWTHPSAGPVPPSCFVPYAERAGLIDRLGLWCLRRACRDARLWPDLTVSVNVSPLQLRNEKLLREIADCLTAYDLPARRIELEITESAVFDDADRAAGLMRELHEAGLAIALDDFGTGYTSLSYLRRLPWDKVKIDKSFVDDVGLMTGAAIVHAVVALARALGLKVTAEGVETSEQQKFLKLAGCHYLQGYYFSKPVPASGVCEILASACNLTAR